MKRKTPVNPWCLACMMEVEDRYDCPCEGKAKRCSFNMTKKQYDKERRLRDRRKEKRWKRYLMYGGKSGMKARKAPRPGRPKVKERICNASTPTNDACGCYRDRHENL